MSFHSEVTITGKLVIQKTDGLTGEVTEINVDNLIVTTGKTFIASRMVGASSSVMSHMGAGADVTPANIADLALGSQLGARVVLTGSSEVLNTVTYTATFGVGVATGDWTEAGIFNHLTAGTMLCRTVFPIVTKGAGDIIVITWIVTVN